MALRRRDFILVGHSNLVAFGSEADIAVEYERHTKARGRQPFAPALFLVVGRFAMMFAAPVACVHSDVQHRP
jgi:hypothetical protein